MSNIKHIGRVVYFSGRYGTIRFDDGYGKKSIFVHINDCNIEPVVNDMVRFTIGYNSRGMKAQNVEVLKDGTVKKNY